MGVICARFACVLSGRTQHNQLHFQTSGIAAQGVVESCHVLRTRSLSAHQVQRVASTQRACGIQNQFRGAVEVDRIHGKQFQVSSYHALEALPGTKGAERSTRKPEVLRRLDMLARQVTVIYPTSAAICRHSGCG